MKDKQTKPEMRFVPIYSGGELVKWSSPESDVYLGDADGILVEIYDERQKFNEDNFWKESGFRQTEFDTRFGAGTKPLYTIQIFGAMYNNQWSTQPWAIIMEHSPFRAFETLLAGPEHLKFVVTEDNGEASQYDAVYIRVTTWRV